MPLGARHCRVLPDARQDLSTDLGGLKDANGSITRGDRIEAFDDLRDAFVQSLNIAQRLRPCAAALTDRAHTRFPARQPRREGSLLPIVWSSNCSRPGLLMGA